MGPHEDGEHTLIVSGEPRHDRVFDEVRAVAMLTGERHRKPDLVHPRRPRQQRTVLVRVEGPRLGDVVEQTERRLFHSLRLRGVDVVPLLEHPNRAIADVLVGDPAEEVVQHSFAERPGRERHPLDSEALEQRHHDRGAADDHRTSLRREPRERDVVDALERKERVLQACETLRRDGAVGPPVRVQDLIDGRDRPGGADRPVPTPLAKPPFDAVQFESGRDDRLVESSLRQLAAGEEVERVRDATHVEAV